MKKTRKKKLPDKVNRVKNARSNIDRVYKDYLKFNAFNTDSTHIRTNNLINRTIKKKFVKDRIKQLTYLKLVNKNLNKVGDRTKEKYRDVKNRFNDELKELRRIKVCSGRQSRRESLFALARIGKGKGSRKRHIWNNDSRKVRC